MLSASRLKICIPTILAVVFLPISFWGQTAEVYVSSKGGDRLARKPNITFQPTAASRGATFEVNDSVKYQKMDGFGASLLEAGLIVLNSLPADQQEAVLRSLFDAKEGAGFTAMKTEIAGTDFQSAGPWYTYDDVPGDVEMKNFSIARDLGPNGMATFIKRARKYGSFALQAPMDYPPDWMLFECQQEPGCRSQVFSGAGSILHTLS